MTLLQKIKAYLAAPAHAVNTNYHIMALALAVSVYLILVILQPFGINEGPAEKYFYLLGFLAITYVGSVIPTAIMHRIYKTEVEEGRFSNGKNITAYLLSVLLIMIGNFWYFKFLNPDIPALSMLWAAIWQTIIISILLLGVYFAFNNVQLRRELERIQQINARLSQKTTQQHEPAPESTPNVETQNFASLQPAATSAAPKNLDYPIDPATLLYIESDKNYCKITTAAGTSVLRSTLTTLENQLKPCGHVIRCHRAFLVNMQSVEGILGSSSAGYKLKIKDCDATVPVSRTYIAEVLGYFEG
jgi:hypothetical protein